VPAHIVYLQTATATILLHPQIQCHHRPRPQLTPPLPIVFGGYKRSTPLWRNPFLPPLPLRRNYATVLAVVKPLRTATLIPLRTPCQRPKLGTDAMSSLDPLARRPQLLLCSTTIAPRGSVCAAVEPPGPVSPFLPEPPKSIPCVTSYL
jgi:hypothetical protein